MNRVAVFARPSLAAWNPGRLSPALPQALATELQAAILADVLDAARACPAGERTLWSGEPEAGSVPPEGFAIRAQSGETAAERLGRAFATMLAAPGDRALLVCGELPALAVAHLAGAFDALASHEVVLGPTVSGGCVVVGLSQPAPGLLTATAWGANTALAQALEAARREGLRAHVLPALETLDSPADLVRLVAAAAGGARSFGPRSLEALRRIGMLPEHSGGPAGA